MNTGISAALPAHFVITIGRSFGAGGRELGRLLAERLGVAYYDKKLLVEAAQVAGMDAAFFEKNDERAPGFFSSSLPMGFGYAHFAGPGALGSETIYRAQSDFIRDIAMKGPCIIVGRTADYVLRDFPGLLSIFLHAPEDVCIKRILNREDCKDENSARAILRKTNKMRAEFYNFYSDKTWGEAATYHLSFDTSKLSMTAIADIIINYLNSCKQP